MPKPIIVTCAGQVMDVQSAAPVVVVFICCLWLSAWTRHWVESIFLCPNFHNGYVDEKMSPYHLIVAHSESVKIQLWVKYAFNKNVNLRRRLLELSVKSNVRTVL